MIVAVDIETTGLVADEGSILEVACIILNDQFEELAVPFVSLVKPLFQQGYEVMDDFVKNMHTKSGLMDRLYSDVSTLTLRDDLPRRLEVEVRLTEYIKHCVVTDWLASGGAGGGGFDLGSAEDEAARKEYRKRLRSTPLLGSSVHFDRTWLEAHMPDTVRRLSHRLIDVSTVNELALRLAPTVHAHRPGLGPDGKPVAQHRALDDIRASITTLKYYVEQGFINPCMWNSAEKVAG